MGVNKQAVWVMLKKAVKVVLFVFPVPFLMWISLLLLEAINPGHENNHLLSVLVGVMPWIVFVFVWDILKEWYREECLALARAEEASKPVHYGGPETTYSGTENVEAVLPQIHFKSVLSENEFLKATVNPKVKKKTKKKALRKAKKAR